MAEQGATGRRFWISISFSGLGVGCAVYGFAASMWPAIPIGALFALVFGLVAAGMKRGEASAGGLLKVKTDFTGPPPPRPEDDVQQDATREPP